MDRAGRGMVSVRVSVASDPSLRRRILVALSLIAMAPLSSSSGESGQPTGDARWRNSRWLYCEGPLNAGCQYFRAGHFAQAADSFRELALTGPGPFNLYANYNLGYLFEQGFGVEKQSALAVSHYERAALKGIPKAKHRLALLLLTYCRNDPRADCRRSDEERERWALGLLERTTNVLRPMGHRIAPEPIYHSEPHCVAALLHADPSQYPSRLSSAVKFASLQLANFIEAFQDIKGGVVAGAISRDTLPVYYRSLAHWRDVKSDLCSCLGREGVEEPSCDAWESENEQICSLNPDPRSGRRGRCDKGR